MTFAELRHYVVRCAIAALAVYGASACAQTAQAEQPVPEFKLKAAFVYNFALFTEWPQGALPDGAPLQLCFGSNSALRPALMELNDKLVNGRRIVVRSVSDYDTVRHCQVLFLDRIDRDRWPHIRIAAAGKSILTVSDDADLARGNAIIMLYPENDRIAFDIDLQAARQAHLTMSSKLLRLARTLK